MNKTISVIIPAYNSECTIERCLYSVINQTRKADEIIVVNDGSTDRTKFIVEQYRDSCSNIKIINKQNKGLSSARNVGIKNTTMDYVLFLDSDDEIEKNALEKCLQNFSDDIDSVWYKTRVECSYDEKLKKRIDTYLNYGPTGRVDIDDKLLIKLNAPAWSKVVKRENLMSKKIFFPEGRYNEDEAYHLNYFSLFKKSYMLKEKLYIYHIREDSIMGKIRRKTENMRVHMVWNLDCVYNFWIKNNIYKGREDLFEMIILKFFQSAYQGSPNYEKARCVWEMTKLLRKWNLNYKNDYINALYEGKIDINIGIPVDKYNKLSEKIDKLHTIIAIKDKKIKQLTDKITMLKNSTSYKIGRFFTYLPRKIKSM